MQILFNAEDKPQAYVEGNGKYPEAPERCPQKDCKAPIKMKKHGYYKRYIFVTGFFGIIRVRRYKCSVCGRTVSMLPSFCVPRLQYGVEIIILALLVAVEFSVKYAGTKWPGGAQNLTRRHIIYYRKRIIRNRGYIQLALNLMSPGFIELKQIAGDSEWTQEFLKVATQINPPRFNSKYHNLTGESFMSLHNKVA